MSKILIAAGGTGGHIFPAIVFGRELQDQGSEVSWLCGSRELERTIYRSSGIEPVVLPLSGSPIGTRSPSKIFARTVDVFRSLKITSRYMAEFMPDEVYLFGGYVSFAPLVVARRRHIPVTLHEQNAVAGRVTRIAAKLGAKIITGWPVCEGIESFTYTGVPVREPVRMPKREALDVLGLKLPEAAHIVGVAGGSLGSGPLNLLLRAAASLCTDCEFVFLSSRDRRDVANVHFIPAQWDMNPFYSICDILVCRAGGSTLAEALKWEIPTISVPWSGAADNHQVKNAKQFEKLSGNAHIFPEDGKSEELAAIIRDIIHENFATR